MASLIGKEIGKYRITERLGQGGMAEVYLGIHTHLDRKVAVKVLHSHLLEGGDFVARFKREAKAVANLRHPNIIQVHDFDVQEDLIFMVMEYIDGTNLHARLVEVGNRGEKLPLKLIGSIINDISSALDYAHSKGMLHRDIKPSNILIDQEDKAYLVDFGIAKLLSDQKFTATGTLVGTPAYMSPEQGRGDELTEESDIYSLGIVAFEMLTGQVPFDARTPIGIVHKQINDPVPNISELVDGVPSTAQAVINRALAKSPEGRYSSAEALTTALRIALEALESTDPIAAEAQDDPPTLIDDGLESPTVTMRAEELEQATVVMETKAKKEEPAKEAPPEKKTKEKPAPKPKGEKKKIPLAAIIGGAIAVLAVIAVILTQVLDFGTTTPNTPAQPDSIPVVDAQPVEQDEVNGEELFHQGEAALSEGRPGEALELFDRAIDAGFETDFLYHLRAWAFFNLGITEGAIESWSRAIELNPENYEYWMERGLRKNDLGDIPGALDDLLVAREYGPDQWSVFEALGEVYYFSGQDQYFGVAHEAFDRAIELEPTNPQSRQMRAELKWFRNGNAEAALEDINIAVEYADPGNPAPLYMRGTIYLETGRFELCIPDYNRALEISPEEPWYFLKRGDCFAGLGDVDAARADYERFIGLTENNPDFNEQVDQIENWLKEH